MKVTTVSIQQILEFDRFEPRYFYMLNKHKSIFEKSGYEILDDIATLTSGTTPEHTDEKVNDTDVCFIKSADIKRFAINYQTSRFITKERHQIQKRSTVKKNDVLISNTGKYLGFSSLFTEYYPEANINQNSIRIRLNETAKTVYNPYFISLFLNSKFGQEEIQSYLTITGQKYLNMQNFRKFQLPKFSKKFIDEISEKLKTIYDYDKEAIELIEEAKKYFSEKLSIRNNKIKQPQSFSVNLSKFVNEDNWTARFSNPLFIETDKLISSKFPTVKLADIVNLQKGDEPGSDKYIEYIDAKESDIPFIRTTDIVNHECDLFPDFFILKEFSNELNQDIKAGDILFTKDGKIGETAFVTEVDKIVLQSHIVRMRLNSIAQKNNITPEYFLIALSLKEVGQYQAQRFTVVQSTIPTIGKRINDIKIPVLKKEQIKFITEKTKKAFKLKSDRKNLIKEVKEEIDKYFIKSQENF